MTAPTPILILTNTHAQRNHLVSSNQKLAAFKSLIEYCTKWVTINDLHAFGTDPMGYFTKAFESQKMEGFPTALSSDTVMELLKVDLTTLRSLVNAVVSNPIEVNYKDMTPIAKDFGIYAESVEEIARYKDCEALADAIQKIHDKGTKMRWGDVINATGMILVYDHLENKLKPSQYYVRQNKR